MFNDEENWDETISFDDDDDEEEEEEEEEEELAEEQTSESGNGKTAPAVADKVQAEATKPDEKTTGSEISDDQDVVMEEEAEEEAEEEVEVEEEEEEEEEVEVEAEEIEVDSMVDTDVAADADDETVLSAGTKRPRGDDGVVPSKEARTTGDSVSSSTVPPQVEDAASATTAPTASATSTSIPDDDIFNDPAFVDGADRLMLTAEIGREERITKEAVEFKAGQSQSAGTSIHLLLQELRMSAQYNKAAIDETQKTLSSLQEAFAAHTAATQEKHAELLKALRGVRQSDPTALVNEESTEKILSKVTAGIDAGLRKVLAEQADHAARLTATVDDNQKRFLAAVAEASDETRKYTDMSLAERDRVAIERADGASAMRSTTHLSVKEIGKIVSGMTKRQEEIGADVLENRTSMAALAERVDGYAEDVPKQRKEMWQSNLKALNACTNELREHVDEHVGVVRADVEEVRLQVVATRADLRELSGEVGGAIGSVINAV